MNNGYLLSQLKDVNDKNLELIMTSDIIFNRLKLILLNLLSINYEHRIN